MKDNVDLTLHFDFDRFKRNSTSTNGAFSTVFLPGDFIRNAEGRIIMLNFFCHEVMEDLNSFRFGNQLLATGNSELRAFKSREKRLYENPIEDLCIDCSKFNICSGEKRIPWSEYHCEEAEKYFKRSKNRIPWPRRYSQGSARLF